MPFLPPNQQRQSTEGTEPPAVKNKVEYFKNKVEYILFERFDT